MVFKTKRLNILVLGSDGMLGYDVYEFYTRLSRQNDTNIGKVFGVDRAKDQKILSYNQLYDIFRTSVHFDICINCVAYTDTKGAEEHYTDDFRSSKKYLSYKLNSELPLYIAQLCKEYGTKLIHISTDYVFSEENVFREVNSVPIPKSVYGEHKYIGELHIKNVFGNSSKDYIILRTSWIFGTHNSKSFIHKFLLNTFKCIKENREDQLEMTSNEWSVPTSVMFLINCIDYCITNNEYGILNAVPMANDECGVSRFEFAEAVLDYFNVKIASILPEKIEDKRYTKDITLKPIERHTYAPINSALKTSFNDAVFCCPWQEDLTRFLDGNSFELIQWLKAQLK